MKIKIREKWNPYNSLCYKFKVQIHFYSLNYYNKAGYTYIMGAGVLQGEEKNKDSFFRSLRQNKKMVRIERNNDFFIGIYKEEIKVAKKRGIDIAYDPSIIHLKPVFFDEEGWEEWEFASPNREIFEKILDSKRIKNHEVESKLFYFRDKKIEGIMPLAIYPKLTQKQGEVIRLAVKEGYYENPRRTDLIKMAKKAKKAVSTFQVLLRTAENKLIPLFLRTINK